MSEEDEAFWTAKILRSIAALAGVAVFVVSLIFLPAPVMGAVCVGLGFVGGRWL